MIVQFDLKNTALIKHLVPNSRFLVLLAILLVTISDAYSQNRHEVEDPEITFSIEIPANWRVEDDG